MMNHEQKKHIEDFSNEFDKLNKSNQEYILGVLRALKFAQDMQAKEQNSQLDKDERVDVSTTEKLY